MMEACSSRFTPAEGGARLAASASTKNTLATEYSSFIATRLVHEEAYKIRGCLFEGSQRSVYVTRVSRIEYIAYELRILTDLSVIEGKEYDDVYDWTTELDKKEVLVCTSAVLKKMLEEEILSMANINVLILDSCHLISKDENLQYIMKLYKDCDENSKPRVLALTYPLFASNKNKESQEYSTEENINSNEDPNNSNNELNSKDERENNEIDLGVEINLKIEHGNNETDSNNGTNLKIKKVNDKIDSTEKHLKMEYEHNEIDSNLKIEHENNEIDSQNLKIEQDNSNTDNQIVVYNKDNTKQAELNLEESSIKDSKSVEIEERASKGITDGSRRHAVEIGVYENVDDFDMYEKLEWKIENLEKDLCCQMDLAEDIDGGKRLSSSLTKPKELIIEYSSKSREEISKSYKELETFMHETINDALEFINDHRHDPSEIYGEELCEEFKNIPDPTIEPRDVFHQFLYVLEQLGPYAADKAAISLLTKLEKLKIKVPYERHFLLLCHCTTIFVKIRCYADLVFSRYDSDWEKIKTFCTPKVMRFAEILEKFHPAENAIDDLRKIERSDSNTKKNNEKGSKQNRAEGSQVNSNRTDDWAKVDRENIADDQNTDTVDGSKTADSESANGSVDVDNSIAADSSKDFDDSFIDNSKRVDSFLNVNEDCNVNVNSSSTLKKMDDLSDLNAQREALSNNGVNNNIFIESSDIAPVLDVNIKHSCKDTNLIGIEGSIETNISECVNTNRSLSDIETNQSNMDGKITYSGAVYSEKHDKQNKNTSDALPNNINDVKTIPNTLTDRMIKDIENCDFTSLGNKIEDRVNIYEANLRDFEDIDSNVQVVDEHGSINVSKPSTEDLITKCNDISTDYPQISISSNAVSANASNIPTSNNDVPNIPANILSEDISNSTISSIIPPKDVLTNSQLVTTNIESVSTIDRTVLRDRVSTIIQTVSTNSQTVLIDTQTAPTNPQTVSTNSQTVLSDPQTAPTNPQTVSTNSHTVLSDTQTAPTNPQTVSINSHTVLSDTQTPPTNSQTVSTNVQTVPTKPSNPTDQSEPRPRRIGPRTRGRGRGQRQAGRGQQQLCPDALCGLVFTKEPLVAKILFMLIVDMSRCNPKLSYLCAQYCTVERKVERSEPKECQRQNKKQEDVLKKFRMHECNLLLATQALEEGIDLPRCNLVLRWDLPPSYRSYGLCRSRARAPRSTAAILCDGRPPTANALLENVATYKELDQIITRKCCCGVQDEPPQTEEDEADPFTVIIRPYTPNESFNTNFSNKNSTESVQFQVENGLEQLVVKENVRASVKETTSGRYSTNEAVGDELSAFCNKEFDINNINSVEDNENHRIISEKHANVDNVDNKGIQLAEVINNCENRQMNKFDIESCKNISLDDQNLKGLIQASNANNRSIYKNQNLDISNHDDEEMCNQVDSEASSNIDNKDIYINDLSKEISDNSENDKIKSCNKRTDKNDIFINNIQSYSIEDTRQDQGKNGSYHNKIMNTAASSISHETSNSSEIEIMDSKVSLDNDKVNLDDKNDTKVCLDKVFTKICLHNDEVDSGVKMGDKFVGLSDKVTNCDSVRNVNVKESDSLASVDLNSAIALINRYCGKLPSDTFTRLAPQWWMEEVEMPVKGTGETRTAYICTLRLPLNCPVKYNIVGHPMPSRVLARRMVALQACRILHRSGELDNQLTPIGKENFKAADLETTTNYNNESGDMNDIARPGTTKRRQYYFKRTAWAFTDCQPIVDTSDSEIDPPGGDTKQKKQPEVEKEANNGKKQNMLYALISTLRCALPERYNTRGRRLHAPQNATQAMGILMARDEPDNLQIPAFPVYTRSGEVRVSVEHVPDADVRLSPRRGRLIRRFMRFVFAEVLRVRRRGMKLQSEGSTHNNYYVVPTVKTLRDDGTSKIDIDWAFLELIYQHTEEKKHSEIERPILWHQDEEEEDGNIQDTVRDTEKKDNDKVMQNPLLKEGEVFVFDEQKYKEAVVTPWYRNRDQPQFFLVAEICWNLTPDSAFPSATHSSFREYYRSKYNAVLTQSTQPLLDVDHTSARLNLLTPRYVNRKGVALPVSSERTRRAKRDRLDQKQILVPELCRVHPFAAPLWFATVALPCVLYRINALLIADEIRRAVAIDVGLGIPKIDDTTMPGFQWPPLDFGWSLAEVLNADSEKTEKKREDDDYNKREQKESRDKEENEKFQTDEEDYKRLEVREKTINEILQEKEEAENTFEIGTWSNEMASSIPQEVEYDEFMEPLPPNLTFCTSASGGTNWCDPLERPKSQFNPTRTYTMADSDCSYMSSDFDTDASDFDSQMSEDETDNSGFSCSKNSNTAMGVRIEYKTAHEAEAVDLERKKVNPAPQPDEADDELDRREYDRFIRSGEAPFEHIQKFRDSVVGHKKDIIDKGLLIKQDKTIDDILPEPPKDQTKHSKVIDDERIDRLFPFSTEHLNFENGQVTLDSIEKNKRALLDGLKRKLSMDELKKLNCFSMVDIDIDSPNYVNEKIANMGFDDKEVYMGLGRTGEFKPYYAETKDGFDFDFQPALEGHPGPSPSVILQALTMSNANDGINLERLETIGDSFLKFAITAYLYCAHPTVHEGKLSHMRSKQVSNLNLYRLGRNKRLGARMIASKFEPHDNWLPPCHKPPPTLHPRTNDSQEQSQKSSETPQDGAGCFIPYNLITQHSIPDKSIADCVEALIGAYLLECGPRGALLFMSWLGIRVLPLHYIPLSEDHPYVRDYKETKDEKPPSTPSPKRRRRLSSSSSSSDCTSTDDEEDEQSQEREEIRTPPEEWGWEGRPVGSRRPVRGDDGKWVLPIYGELKAPPSPLLRYIADPEGELEQMLSGYDALEKTLQYRFNDRSLLLQALTHASHQRNRLTDCYQRLEFLGDAILDYLITRHLYEDPRRHSPGALTDLRSALVNNTIFATLAARHGFHKFFRHMSPGLNEVLTKYVKIQEENGHSISEEHYLIQEDEMEQAEDVEVPKALGDLFESVAGAIFLDSGMSLGAVWKSYVNLMGAELEAFSAAAPKSPVRELLEAEPDTAKFGKPERLADGRRVRVCVEVFGRGAFKGIGRNYRIAKGTAARCALRHLKIHKAR